MRLKPTLVAASMGLALVALAGARVTVSTAPVDPWFNAPAVNAPPLLATFENGIAILGDDGHWYKAEVDGGEIHPVQISNSPLDPVVADAMAKSNRAARIAIRQAWRETTMGVKTGVVQVIRDTRALLQSGTGIIDRVKAAQVGAGANAGEVRTGHRLLVGEVETLARDKRELERTVRELSIQVRELTDIVRQQNLNVDTKSEPKE